MRPAARALLAFWGGVGAILLVGGGVLEWLGPPRHRAVPKPPVPAPLIPAAAADMLQPVPDLPGHFLPVRRADGLTSAQRYRAPVPQPCGKVRIAVLLEGIGLIDEAESGTIKALPPAVSLSVSPYATLLDQPAPYPVLDQARALGHELWLSLPMEPGADTANEGGRQLSTVADAAQNRAALEWALSRFTGYVGLTDSNSFLFGRRFASSPGFVDVADALRTRGLLYVEAPDVGHTPDAVPPPTTSRVADLELDGRSAEADLEQQLAGVPAIASKTGAALVVISPAPADARAAVTRWARTLPAQNITLVPASAIVAPQPNGACKEKAA